MRPTVRLLISIPAARTCSPSNEADQCVIGSPTSAGSRQASASTRAASASEREKAAGPISGRPQACRRAHRNRSAVAILEPCECERPTRERCRYPALRPPSSAALGPDEQRVAQPWQAVSQPGPLREFPPTRRLAPSDDRRAGDPPARRIRSCAVIKPNRSAWKEESGETSAGRH